MTNKRYGLVLSACLMLAATAACSDDDTQPDAGSDTATGTPSATMSANPAPDCVVDSWRATGVQASGEVGTATGKISGGSGTTMTVDKDGITQVQFSDAQPLDFSANVGGVTAKGQVRYDGTVRGALQFEPQAGNEGKWDPTGEITWNELRGTVRMTEPISVTLLDNARISDFTGDKATQAGGAVDIQPVLRGGTYTCEGDTLEIRTEENGPALMWTFTRA